jgi:hypothetical protein
MTFVSGQILEVKTFGGAVVKRRLVRVFDGFAAVTTAEEWAAAEKEGRDPVCIGFPLSDVSADRQNASHED